MQHHQKRDSEQEHAKWYPEVAVRQNSFGKAGRLHLKFFLHGHPAVCLCNTEDALSRKDINETNTVNVSAFGAERKVRCEALACQADMIRKLCNVDQLPEEGKLKAMQGNGLDLCVGVLEGKPYAVQNQCPHQGAPLAAGCLQDGYVVCPYHAWRFRLSDGAPEATGDPSLSTYGVRAYGDEVFIQLK